MKHMMVLQNNEEVLVFTGNRDDLLTIRNLNQQGNHIMTLREIDDEINPAVKKIEVK